MLAANLHSFLTIATLFAIKKGESHVSDAASGIMSILIIIAGFLVFYFFRPIAFFCLTLGAFMLPSGFKYFCFIPLLLFLIRYVRMRDVRALIIFALSVIPAMSIGGGAAWNQTSWGKQQAAERAAKPVILTPEQQAGLACAREIKAYLESAKPKAQAADSTMDRAWPTFQIGQACDKAFHFQAEHAKKYMKMSDKDISTWNNRITSIDAEIRDYAAVAAKMESDLKAIVSRHFPPDVMSGDIIPFASVIDPFADIPHRLEESIHSRFAAAPKWAGDETFASLALVPGEDEPTRKTKGDKFCDAFANHSGLGSQIMGAINRGLVFVDAEIARLAPKHAKKFNLNLK